MRWNRVWLGLLIIVLCACAAPLEVAHFKPAYARLFQIEFDVPVGWQLILTTQEERFEGYAIYNPLCLPDERLNCPPEDRYDTGVIDIWVSLEDNPLEQLKFLSGTSPDIEIGGYPSARLERHTPSGKIPGKGLPIQAKVYASIYIATEDRLYRFHYNIAERLWDSDFTRGFNLMINSIQFVD